MSRLDVVVDRLASGAALIRLTGEFEHEFAYTLDVQLQKVEAETETLVLDLRGLFFMDSAGLGRLLAARRRAARARRRLVIVRGGRVVDRVMMLAGLQDVFEMVGDVPPELLVPPAPGTAPMMAAPAASATMAE
jgi:anti-anti-sigma factor